MGKKKDIKDVRQEFEAEGYQLLTTIYQNNLQRLKYICPKGHVGTIRYGDWQQGHRCDECGGTKKLTIEFIRTEFAKEGYQLLTTEYSGAYQKLSFICPQGHKDVMTWNSWKKGSRCKECQGIKKKDIEFIKSEFEKEGYQLLTTTYKDNKGILEYICPQGHRSKTSWNSWERGKRCRFCGYKKVSDDTKYSIDFVRSSFEKEGYTLLTQDYQNNKQRLEYICPKGHRGYTRFDNWLHGKARCLACFRSGKSKAEVELYDFVKQYFPNTLHNDRKIIYPRELDIVVPSKRVAIEYCGLYWHSELAGGKTKNYHLDKLNDCTKAGYRLITIFEDEFLNHPDIVKDRLKIILGVADSTKVNARDCTIKEIDSKTARLFCETNHIQGYGNSNIKLGAYIDNALLSVMTFSKPSVAKGTKNTVNQFELNRFCSLIGFHIRGIASKFLSYFRTAYSGSKVFSYADKRWSDGGLYNTLGFKYLHDSEPNYWYLEGFDRVHRFNFRKNVLENKLEEFDSSLSEWQNMINNGYDRIWDCGNSKWGLA